MRQRFYIGLVASAIVAFALFGSAAAETRVPPTTPLVGARAVKADGKLSARLAMLARAPSLRAASAIDQAQALSTAPAGPGSLVRDAQGRLLAEIRSDDLSPAYQQALRAAGADITHISERYATIAAYLDPARLTEIEALAATQSVQEALAPIVGHAGYASPAGPASTCPQGTAVSEGDTQLRAALARSNYSLTGTGVQVGVLSDSFNDNLGASADVTSGDLPGATNTCGYTTPVNVLYESTTTDEGRAMAQIVHDLAPAATLSFATANGGQVAFGDHIRALKAAGASVIVDDVIYFAEPYFQDGIPAVAISDTVRTGALYFTAATNVNVIVGGNNVASNEAPAYRPTSCRAGVTDPSCHNFNPSGGTQNSLDFTLASGYAVRVVLQWAEPWYGVTTDLDAYLTNDAGTVLVSSLNNNPGTTQQPFEYMYYGNSSGVPVNLHVSVSRYSGAATPRLKVVLFTNCNCGLSNVSPATSAGGDIVGPTIMGHTSNRDAFSVAAAPYNDDNNPEGYSARGPAAHYFGPVVNTTPAAAIPTETIQQPDFTATDGGCNTFFGGFSSGCYRFYGTSAAAPHAAAIAALLKQKANALGKPLSRGTAQMILQTSARAMSGGNLNSVGAGLLDANAAVAKLINTKWLYLPAILR
ncbi:MAG: S8 family serine peptidase [Chloroflexi bacterium]|nr:S8 family serine peptidase [Chloroflexota bacterium]